MVDYIFDLFWEAKTFLILAFALRIIWVGVRSSNSEADRMIEEDRRKMRDLGYTEEEAHNSPYLTNAQKAHYMHRMARRNRRNRDMEQTANRKKAENWFVSGICEWCDRGGSQSKEVVFIDGDFDTKLCPNCGGVRGPFVHKDGPTQEEWDAHRQSVIDGAIFFGGNNGGGREAISEVTSFSDLNEMIHLREIGDD